MSKVWIYGFNPFDLNSDGELKEVPLDTHFPNHDLEHFLMELTSTHALVASGNILYSKSCITEQANELDCGSRIVQLAANNWHCLVLLDSGTLLKYDIHSNQSIRLGFLAVENVSNSDEKTEKVTHIACGDTVSLAVTSEKSVYNIPNKTFTFPRHARIRKIAVGLEHCLLLTGNGDVYSWGCGLRGQLGNGEITPNQEQPQLVEALAGVKIIDVAAGGWHSAAVSSFGDLYCWGWNSKGQLGLVDEKQTRGSVFTLPQVIELDERNEDVVLERVYCGSGHTIVVSNTGMLYTAGNDLRQKLDYTKVERNPKLIGFRKFESVPDCGGEMNLISGPNSIAFMTKVNEPASVGKQYKVAPVAGRGLKR